MKMLITGGAGFIGSYMAEYFAERGEELVLFDNMSRTVYQPRTGKTYDYNWRHLDRYSGISRAPGDVRDYEVLETAAEDAEVIIHAAAQTQISASIADPIEDLSVNVLGSYNVLEAARRSGKCPAVIYLSTSKVYGTNVNRLKTKTAGDFEVFAGEYAEGIGESFPVDGFGHTPFGASKLAADIYMQEFAHLYGLKVGVFRLSAVYGPRQFGIEEQGWAGKMVLDALLGRPMMIEGNGSIVRDLLYVQDLPPLIDGFLRSEARFGLFNAGGGRANLMTPVKLVEELEQKTGKDLKPQYGEALPFEPRIFYADNSKAQKLLGWQPKVGVEEGVSAMVKWVEDNRNLFE